MASDSKYVNFEQYHEIRDWLIRQGYSGSAPNWEYMKSLAPTIKILLNKTSSEHLTWEELDSFHKINPLPFMRLKK